MKKILYYLSNIILGIYLIIYGKLSSLVINVIKSLPESTRNINGIEFEVMHAPGMETNQIMFNISCIVIVISCILKIIFRSTKFELTKTEKFINTIVFLIEIVLLFFLRGIFAWA